MVGYILNIGHWTVSVMSLILTSWSTCIGNCKCHPVTHIQFLSIYTNQNNTTILLSNSNNLATLANHSITHVFVFFLESEELNSIFKWNWKLSEVVTAFISNCFPAELDAGASLRARLALVYRGPVLSASQDYRAAPDSPRLSLPGGLGSVYAGGGRDKQRRSILNMENQILPSSHTRLVVNWLWWRAETE